MSKLLGFMMVGLVVVALLLPEQTLAQGAEDDDVTVVSIRKKYFLKGKRHEFGPQVGFVANDTFSNSYMIGGTYGYHLNERLFFEIPAGLYLTSESNSTKNLRSNFGIQPDLDDLEYFAEGHVGWSPIYGKFNFLTRQIVYFDVSFYGGAGVTSAEVSGLSPHAVFGGAARIVLKKWVAF